MQKSPRSAAVLLNCGEDVAALVPHVLPPANGTARVAAVTLDDVAIEDITVHNVRAVVAEPGNLQTTLLGMTFLSQLSRTEMSRGVLLLER